MVGKGGLGGLQHAPDAGEGEIVARQFRVIAQRQVGDRKLHLLGQLQQQPARHTVFGADVGVDEGIGLHAVDVAQEQAEHLLGEGAVLPDDEGLEQLVEVAEVDREGRDRRNVAVEDLQRVHRLKQILRRLEGEEFAALLEQQRIVRADIARAVGHHALVEIAERALLFRLVIGVGIAQGIVGALAQAGQREQLLMIGQGRVLNDVQRVGHDGSPL